MSEEELIKYIKNLTEITKENNKRGIEVGVEISVEMAEQLISIIEKQQKEIENKDKIIDLMADTFDGLDDGDTYYLAGLGSKKEIIEYFRNKVERK